MQGPCPSSELPHQAVGRIEKLSEILLFNDGTPDNISHKAETYYPFQLFIVPSTTSPSLPLGA
jgi:hypothetical protein